MGEHVLIAIPLQFQRGEGVGVAMAPSLLFWGGEVDFTTTLVKIGEGEPPHLPMGEKEKRMPLYPPLL